MDEQEEYLQQPYGDDKVHFDPIRAVQSIKLSNNYRTARSNDNFLSTIILNTYFFNNAVLHHNEIKQPPPKLPYEADNSYHSSSSCSSSLSDDESCCSSCDCSSTESNSEYDDIKIQNNIPKKKPNIIKHKVSASQNNISNIDSLKFNNNNQPRRYKFGHKFRKKKMNKNNNNNNNNIGNNSLSDLEHAKSTPNNYKNNQLHQKSNTMTNLYYVPSKTRHKANPNKASQILGINSDAVIFANNKYKNKKKNNSKKKNIFQHRKSNSFSETLRNIKNGNNNNNNNNNNEIEEKKYENAEIENENDSEVMDDDEFAFKQLKFDRFKPQKRNTGRHIIRSKTIDFTNKKNIINSINIQDENNNNKKYKKEKYIKHIKHISLMNNGNNNINNNNINNNIESSDVIEIKFQIDNTKTGYLFIGIISANKINNVVQPGFIFGFNEYTYSFHGYSGKLYHNKIQNDYYFLPNNITNNNKQQKNKQLKQRRINRSNTVDITQGISNINNNNNNNNINEQKEEEEKQNNNNNNHGNNNNNKKLPVLQSGDIITIKMKLNKNNGKFGVIYCINNIDYGIAWKTIDPPITIGITMVGRKEQITLLSCSYKPYKNDKSCVIL